MSYRGKRLMNVFAHYISGPDSIRYRVQWDNRDCEWVDGNFVSAHHSFASFVIKYWQKGPREMADSTTQTPPIHSFDFRRNRTNVRYWTKNFRQYCFDEPEINYIEGLDTPKEKLPPGLVPNSIEKIDVEHNIAIVHYKDDTSGEMNLDLLVGIAPHMVGQYYIDLCPQS